MTLLELLKKNNWYCDTDNVIGLITFQVYNKNGIKVGRKRIVKELGKKEIEIEIEAQALTTRIFTDKR